MTTKKKNKPAGEQLTLFDMLDKRIGTVEDAVGVTNMLLKNIGERVGGIEQSFAHSIKEFDADKQGAIRDLNRIAYTLAEGLSLAREVLGQWLPAKNTAKKG